MRQQPHSAEAEMGAIGCMLIAPLEIIAECAESITAAHFYVPAHATIFSLLVELWRAHKPIEFITLTNTLRDRSELDKVGGPGFINDLFAFVPSAGNVSHYLDIIREKKFLRDVIAAGNEIVTRAMNEQDEVPKLKADFENFLFRFTSDGKATRKRSTKDIVLDVMDSLDEPEKVFGISTGFPSLDAVIGGLAEKAKIVLAGQISGGKSAMAHNIAISLAVKRQIPTAYFSFEMGDNQTVQRIIQTHAEVSIRDVVRNDPDIFKVKKFQEAATEVARAPLFIEVERRDIAGIRSRLMQLIANNCVRVAIIDYLQIVPEQKQRGENRTDQLDRMSAETKQIAHSLGITLIELSQLTKTDTGFKTRGSSGITADADILLIIDGEEPDKEIIVAKQRDGKKDKVKFRFQGDITRFYEVEKKY